MKIYKSLIAFLVDCNDEKYDWHMMVFIWFIFAILLGSLGSIFVFFGG